MHTTKEKKYLDLPRLLPRRNFQNVEPNLPLRLYCCTYPDAEEGLEVFEISKTVFDGYGNPGYGYAYPGFCKWFCACA